jgi:hypothetical protein
MRCGAGESGNIDVQVVGLSLGAGCGLGRVSDGKEMAMVDDWGEGDDL